MAKNSITVRWCAAALTRRWLVIRRTVVRCRVFVAIPTCDAALLISRARAILPLSEAPATVILILALSVLDGTWLAAFAGAFDVTVGAGYVSR
jgi:hypothetical protein